MFAALDRSADSPRPSVTEGSSRWKVGRWTPLLLLVAALALPTPRLSGAVSYAAWITVDSECEFSGEWSARVGYLGPEGKDPPAHVTLTGLILGSTFQLNLPNPYSGMSAELFDDQLTLADSLSVSGNWLGEASGWFEETSGERHYSLQATYSEGGFNSSEGDPGEPADDSVWGWWYGTFSIRQSACASTVPEPATSLCLISLGCGLILVRRRAQSSGD